MANKVSSSAQCKHYQICGLDVEGNPAEGLCILHSTDPAKDTDAFAEALATHRERTGDNFTDFVFPGIADFARATFSGAADFSGATFSGAADFSGATFGGDASFFEATFGEGARFAKATFGKGVNFSRATFSWDPDFISTTFGEDARFFEATFGGGASFFKATFGGDADFARAWFSKGASFFDATFSGDADFSGATFSGKTSFHGATFSGRTRFARRSVRAPVGGPRSPRPPRPAEAGHIFAGTEVDFRQVVIDPPDAATFLEADLTKCQFQDTDLRKVQMVGEEWPQTYWHKISRRTVVYDECLLWKEKNDRSTATRSLPWSQLERLYRELKQNYEDRRDYERAGDFHYGEKEMRRQNPGTTGGLRLFLTLYWLFSGYGERYLRPLLWARLLFVGSTFGYMWWGLRPKDGGSSLVWTNDGWDLLGRSSLVWTNGWDWLQGAYYSFRVMTFLKPDDWIPVGYAHVINTFQTLLAPIFLGLFALALRQRLKR
jgi:uncharacterized protein YjbI with pentapeptide repeats